MENKLKVLFASLYVLICSCSDINASDTYYHNSETDDILSDIVHKIQSSKKYLLNICSQNEQHKHNILTLIKDLDDIIKNYQSGNLQFNSYINKCTKINDDIQNIKQLTDTIYYGTSDILEHLSGLARLDEELVG